ncbi:myosin head (motor domain) domain-containing protein [Ditylenchus destructor]|uniref:Myosin head (Motor domain) domain-containing protein n=1 Tax=Ditylenchus destructor TaxID=166010 RepID=A0AAD4RAR9_9BILA|nr:myosin head (motor domain) domain-containing protein [Ditylenchus destructor]
MAVSMFGGQSATKMSNSTEPECPGHGRLVYVPDKVEGYTLGRVLDIGADTITIKLLQNSNTVRAPYSEILPAEEDQKKDVDDNCALMFLNEATLLHNCRLRYTRRQIYTYVANILISINPYEPVPDLYSSETIRKYDGKSLGSLPPHIFAIADKAYRDMRRLKQSQSIIVSGESGAGKTESQKCILRYLCQCWGLSAGPVEQRILETNPILEAFGNAKTLRNNNSSRFGKFVEIHFNKQGQVAGGYVSHYLLEKTRVCFQQHGERNFHIFYQLFASDASLTKQLCLTNPDHFHYLRSGCTQFFATAASGKNIPADRKSKECISQGTLEDLMVDDYANFQRLYRALIDVGLEGKILEDLFRTLAGILHLGNIVFDDSANDSKGGSCIHPKSFDSLAMVAGFLGIDTNQLRLGLTSRMMQPTKGGVKGTLIMVPLKSHEAIAARDALAKAIYSRLFDYIVASINKSIPFGSSDGLGFIGVLDIAGFEFFEVNSFEQFCINYCNEKLQQFFNDRILKQEQDLYAKEALNVSRIEFSDNQDCIDLFEAKANGLLDCLDEERRLPRPSPQHFTCTVHQLHQKNPRIATPRKSSERRYKEMRDDEGFLVRHYANDVCYETALFVDKNKDALHISLEMLIEESTNTFIRAAFDSHKISENDNKNIGHVQKSMGKLNIASVSSKFRSQLASLMCKLTETGTHFVRCIKPNSEMAPGKFQGAQILGQLRCAGMGAVLKLMHKGFPSRAVFSDMYAMYQQYLPPQLARLDARLFCKCLFYALGLNDADYKFGLTKVFFRSGKFSEFDQLMKQDPAEMKRLISKVQCWIYKIRWKKAQYGVWSCIKLKNKIRYRADHLIKLQSGVRGYIARKKYRTRLLAFRYANAIIKGMPRILEVAARVGQKEIRARWQEEMEKLQSDVENLIQDIKANAITGEDAHKKSLALQSHFDMQLTKLREHIDREQQEHIKQAQAEAEKLKIQEMEEHKKREVQMALIEERRQLEYNRQQIAANAIPIEYPPKQAENLSAVQYKTFQSVETQTAHEQTIIESSPSGYKYDLLQWTYAKLRDAINTSTRTIGRSGVTSQNYKPIPMTGVCLQRYFRVPFEKPVGTNDYSYYNYGRGRPLPVSSCGFWLAHFDGQYCVRQIELHPSKPALLLVAGKDDEKMCELRLDETGLTRKKGAEILMTDFEALWIRYGGMPYRKADDYTHFGHL